MYCPDTLRCSNLPLTGLKLIPIQKTFMNLTHLFLSTTEMQKRFVKLSFMLRSLHLQDMCSLYTLSGLIGNAVALCAGGNTIDSKTMLHALIGGSHLHCRSGTHVVLPCKGCGVKASQLNLPTQLVSAEYYCMQVVHN